MAISQMNKRKALLVGIDQYKERSVFPSLQYAERDAEELAAVLSRQYGFVTRVLTGKKATRDNIEQYYQSIAGAEELIFFFAGHGQMIGDHYRLQTYDSTLAGFKALSLDELTGYWRFVNTNVKVLAILDACRSNRSSERAVGLDSGSVRDLHAVVSDNSWIELLYGCSEGEVCYEIDDFKHGLLSHFLIDVLNSTKKMLALFA